MSGYSKYIGLNPSIKSHYAYTGSNSLDYSRHINTMSDTEDGTYPYSAIYKPLFRKSVFNSSNDVLFTLATDEFNMVKILLYVYSFPQGGQSQQTASSTIIEWRYYSNAYDNSGEGGHHVHSALYCTQEGDITGLNTGAFFVDDGVNGIQAIDQSTGIGGNVTFLIYGLANETRYKGMYWYI